MEDRNKVSSEMIMETVENTKIENSDNVVSTSIGGGVDLNKYVRPRKTRTIIRKFNHKVGRNEPCPCGAVDENGKRKKFKNCCMGNGNFEGTRELTAQEFAQLRYGTGMPNKYKVDF